MSFIWWPLNLGGDGEEADTGNPNVLLRAAGTAQTVLIRGQLIDGLLPRAPELVATSIRRAPETSQVALRRAPAASDNVLRRP